MWADNDTDRDFLNFTGVADTVAEIIVQASGKPISIGVSGAWGMGKSSMIRLIRRGLTGRTEGRAENFIFVEFNAWLYQGYDDARAALLDVIATTLVTEAEKRKTGIDKAQDLLKRVDWLRAAKLVAPSALALALGLPPAGLVGEIFELGKKAVTGGGGGGELAKLGEKGGEIAGAAGGLLKPAADTSPPKEIQAIRDSFEAALKEMNVTLVVLIDDLDRCLPPTTISTLEAIRLFLFLEHTAFVIAADETMIKHAVRRHFDGVDETLVTNYFDKLIQVPIRVPPLGTQEVRAYLMLVFVENSSLPEPDKETIRKKVCLQLGQAWKRQRVDRAFMMTLHADYPADLVARFETADRIAPLMTKATQIAGNPRLIKRFLNALSIRMTIARQHHVTVDESALTKMLLFERCAPPAAYDAVIKAVTASEDGIPEFLKPWEDQIDAGEKPEVKPPWDDAFLLEWLALPPHLGTHELRGILYVSREHAPLITPEDRLSSEGAELLTAVIESPEMADKLRDRLALLPRPELGIIMDRIVDRSRRETEWGVPPILDAALTAGAIDPAQGRRLAVFLSTLPGSAIKPSIVPKIADQPWSSEVFTAWQKPDVATSVKRAIKARAAGGNI
ncbi:MAG: ATPase [Alphaproteobacteria bacterium]|nr:MAG: ATPase [Alphaproteobacteria bacterium]